MRKPLLISLVLLMGLIAGITSERIYNLSSRFNSGQLIEHTFILLGNVLDTITGDEKVITSNEVMDTKANDKLEREVIHWVAPMDPGYRRNEPGKSPMGMDLVPVYADAGGNDSDVTIIRISPEVVNNLGVRTAQVKKGRFSRRIDTVGYVVFDESKISHIHLRSEGWINNLVVDAEGERVKKGELLFTLYSPTLVNAQEEYLQAITTGNKRLVQASEDRLDVLGVSKTQVKKLIKDKTPAQYVSTYASQSGVISKLNVREGMHVKPETEVMVLANLDTVWVQAEVFERQANWVKVGQDVEARLPSVPGRIWKGKVDYVYPSLDPNTRTLRVRLRFDNPEEFIKPNMYADVSIISEHTDPVIHIPSEALILDGHTPRVIVALGDGRYQSREVVPGVESNERVEIIEGLDESDLLVVSAQFLIDSEANLKASLRRMEPVIQEPEMHHFYPAGEGTINDIKLDNRTINISHGPIKLLDWPAMTMDIGVADHIDLETIKKQSRVKFHLEENESGTYVIRALSPLENGRD